MSTVTETVLLSLQAELSTLADRENVLRAELAEIESKRNEAMGLVVTIKAGKGKGTVKGYAPKVDAGQSDKPANPYAKMTIRAALRAYFSRTDNKPENYRKISAEIGRGRGSVSAVLSMYAEFTQVGSPGMWQAHPGWYSNGWVQIGR